MAVFVIMHFVPGGPVERQIMRMRMATMGEGGAAGGGGRIDVELPEDAIQQIRQYYGFDKPVHIRYALWLWNVLHLNLGNSYIYQDPVWVVIKSRFPISLTIGLTGFFLSYLVCIPLGVLKAVKHGTKFDLLSSFIVFLGYSVPGWALGTALLVLFGGGSFWSVFPLGGFRPDNWDYLNFGQKVVMENMAQDYIRTAFAKGLHKNRVIFVHALRNSLIPLATGIGSVFSLILAGSFLIEKVFNIDGMGYLGYTSILQRDYPVALGILVIGSLLMLVGNIISDIVYALVDPRIRFK